MPDHPAEGDERGAEEAQEAAGLLAGGEDGFAHAGQDIQQTETGLRRQRRQLADIGNALQQHGVIGLHAAERAGDARRLNLQ